MLALYIHCHAITVCNCILLNDDGRRPSKLNDSLGPAECSQSRVHCVTFALCFVLRVQFFLEQLVAFLCLPLCHTVFSIVYRQVNCHRNLPVLNLGLLIASVANNQNFRPRRKTMRWIEINDWHLLELSRRPLSPRKEEMKLRAPAVGAKILVFFVCHAWSACAWGT